MTRNISRRSNGRLLTGRTLSLRYSAPVGRLAGRVRLLSLIVCFALLLQSSAIFPVRGSAQGRVSSTAARGHIFPLSYVTARSLLSTVADRIRSLAGKLSWDRRNSEIYRPAEGVAAAPEPLTLVFVDVPVATITSTSDTQVVISWTAVTGAVTYRVERSPNVLTPYSQVTDSSSTTFKDTNVSRGNTFLYRVRAVDSSGNASAPSSVVFGTAVTFVDDPIFINSTKVKADHVNDLRVAVNGVRRAAGLLDAFWVETVSTGTPVRASHVQELRNRLNEGLTGLGLTTPSFDDATLHTGENGTTPTPIRKVHFEQLRTRSRSGSGVTGSGLTAYDFASARLDAPNRTGTGGVDLVSRNFNWGIPLVGLPGRSGLDLGLSLSYNSLVWTKSGSYVQFDGDGGNPAPGFRLGFPVVQGKFYDSQAAKNAYLMVTPSGARVELRQTSTAEIYEAVDSSYLQLTENPDASLTLRATDGTRMTYSAEGGVYKCTSIEDANGNLITATYDTYGTITSITDTLGRTLTFNYQSSYLQSITQTWHREIDSSPPATVTETHNWARFEYADKTINTNFTGLTIFGPANGQTFHALAKVQLGDDSAFTFDYTTWGQVNKVTALSPDGSLLNYVSLNLPPDQTTAQSDCPRFTERHDWAVYWNGDADGIPDSEGSEVAVTAYGAYDFAGGVGKATAPDGTRHEETYETAGWKKGITTRSDEFSADDTNPKKWTVVKWTQDDESLAYQQNPRVTRTDIYDSVGNHKRTDVTYTSSFGLPSDVKEYNADGLTVLRRTQIEYLEASVTGGAYLTRRIIGLPKERYIYGIEGSTETLASKLTYEYDLTTGEFLADAGTVAQHDAAFGAGFTTRGNLCRVKRWDVQHPSNSLATETGYNTLGSVVFTRDALGHQKTISYIDSDSGARLAYPATVTDPGNFSSALEYNYDMGAPTRTTDPKGAATKIYYDAAGRKLKVKSEFNSAYTRWEYDASGLFSKQLTTVDTGLAETFVMGVSDGAGRTRGTLRELPGSSGGYSAQRFSYNNVGQQVKQYNPTEVTINATSPSNIASWLPAGGDSPSNGGAGWVYSSQKYDWKGRPTVTTNQDDTQKTITYGGCGCAGGEVTTMQGELVPIPGTSTQGRRTQKIYADVLGRQIKTEVLDWDGTTVYSTTTTKYNALDQVKRVRQYIGAAPSPEPDGEGSTYQTTTMTYDGYGRPNSKHVPGQNDGTQTVYEYFDDDTVKSTTDARGVKTTFAYNTRQLVTGVTYDKQGHTSVATDKGGTTDVPDTPAVTVSYDAAGNRETMTDGSGTTTYHFDTMSRLSSEGRQLTGLTGTYTLSYEYTLSGALKKVNDVTAGTNFAYDFDRSGQMTTITSAGLGATAPLASSMQYRAWGALKGVSHGNGTSLALSYSSRGQITHYGVGGVTSDGQYGAVAHGSDFTYYGDGQVKFAADLFTDALVFGNYKLHDRAYSYDHAARLKEAYSGWEANQFATGTASGVDGAFRQSYAYDAFGNNTGRTGSIWTAADNDGQAFDSRGRVTAWEYDPDGRLVSRNEAAPNTQPYEALRDSYDAAGRLAQTTQKTSSSSLVNPNLILTTTRTKTETYDGAGQVVKETTTGQVNNGTPSTSATFYLRSSALGGRVISEYNGSGVRQVTHIMAGAEAVADSWNNSSGPAVIWRHTNPVTGDEIDTDAQGAVSSKVTLDPTGTNLGDTDPSTGTGGFDEGGGPSQGQMNKMYAQLLPPSAGGNAPQARVDGFQVNASVAYFLLSVGAAKRSPNSTSVLTIYSKSRGENVGLAVYNPQAAEKGVAILGAGSLGYLPVGTNYTQGVGLQFQDWFGSYYSGLHQNFLSEKAAQVYSMPFLGRESPQDTSQQKNCATPNSLVKYFKTQFEAQWDKTAKSAKPGVEGEENGSLIFYEGATNKYPIVELSEGSHVRLGSTSYAPNVPGLPEVGPETSKALADFSSSGRSVYFLAFFHTHPDFPGFPPESRSGDPSDWDKQYQRDYGNVLGIIRTSKGYSFFSNGKAFRSGDAKADECIWELNRASN